MKTIIASNSRPLFRALCTVLIGSAALWAMPRSARAQIYVSQPGDGSLGSTSVGEYNGSTGAPINANFITGLTGGLVLALSGNDLFVSNGITASVGEYNLTRERPTQTSSPGWLARSVSRLSGLPQLSPYYHFGLYAIFILQTNTLRCLLSIRIMFVRIIIIPISFSLLAPVFLGVARSRVSLDCRWQSISDQAR